MNCSADSMAVYLPGWTLVASVQYPRGSPSHDLDQVWISGDLTRVWDTAPLDLRTHSEFSDLIDRSSDHHPAAAIVFLPIY